MKNRLKRSLALLCALALLGASATAGASGLGDFASDYLDVAEDVSFRAGVSISTVMPFNAATVAMLNNVLKHVTIGASLRLDGANADTSLSLDVDGQSVMTLEENQTADGSELTTSLLPNRTLTSAASAMDALAAGDATEPAFDALNAISEVQGVYKALTDAIMPYAEEKKANYKIKSIGTAKWSRIARLTVEQAAELAPQISAVLACGMDQSYRAELAQMTYGKGFVVALYRVGEGGKDMAVYMKGNVTFADGSERKLSYQWAFVDEGTDREDAYKFELTKSRSPSDNRVIAASYTQKKLTNRIELSGKSETTLKNPDATVLTTVKHDLSGKESGNARSFAGTQSTAVKTTVKGKSSTVTTTVSPELSLTAAEGSGALSGTVEVKTVENKKTLTELTLVFDDQPAKLLSEAADSGALYEVADEDVKVTIIDPDSVTAVEPASEPEEAAAEREYQVGAPPLGYQAYTAPSAMQMLDLDSMNDTQRESLEAELSQALAGVLLKAVAALPEEDRALLKDGMTDKDYEAFMTQLNGL